MHLFEAQAPDGLTLWNVFDTVLEQKEYGEDYVMEPIARKMMARRPRAGAGVPRRGWPPTRAFAQSPAQRLDFFYRRSPWADPEQNLLPVARALRAPPEAVLAIRGARPEGRAGTAPCAALAPLRPPGAIYLPSRFSISTAFISSIMMCESEWKKTSSFTSGTIFR